MFKCILVILKSTYQSLTSGHERESSETGTVRQNMQLWDHDQSKPSCFFCRWSRNVTTNGTNATEARLYQKIKSQFLRFYTFTASQLLTLAI